jgi:vacuolar-type H+-ATPase subunit C/Vma6
MFKARPTDLDYVAALAHGRRARMVRGARLESLCRLHTMAELVEALAGNHDASTARELQAALLKNLTEELTELAAPVGADGKHLLGWMLARYQVENLKVRVRGFLTHKPLEVVQQNLIPLPLDLTPTSRRARSARPQQPLLEAAPEGVLRDALSQALVRHLEPERCLLLEAALDTAYFQELLRRLRRLSREDTWAIEGLVWQEIDTYHLMLVIRGRFENQLTTRDLLALHVPGVGISRTRFLSMLADDTPRAASRRAVGHALDELPESAEPTASELEALARDRYLRQANLALRRGTTGLGAVVGYLAERMVEVANLFVVTEGVRMGMASEEMGARLTPRYRGEESRA